MPRPLWNEQSIANGDHVMEKIMYVATSLLVPLLRDTPQDVYALYGEDRWQVVSFVLDDTATFLRDELWDQLS